MSTSLRLSPRVRRSRRVRAAFAAAAMLATPLAALLASTAPAGATPAAATAAQTTSFTTAGMYSFVVPAGVYWVHATIVGGHGGGFLSGLVPGGPGATVTADLAVRPNETLSVAVGGNGADGFVGSRVGSGGYFGGAAGGAGVGSFDQFPYGSGGGGGGASAVGSGIVLNPRNWQTGGLLAIAGGGGGSGMTAGGAGGTPVGGNSAPETAPSCAWFGEGGQVNDSASLHAPELDAASSDLGLTGGAGLPADAGAGGGDGGGGGGGGRYGGSGGASDFPSLAPCASTGGGGGSSWVDTTDASNVSYTKATVAPAVTFTYTADTTAPTVTVSSPSAGTYSHFAPVTASYSCADQAGGPVVASCVGSVANGAPVDTTTLGPHTFTVTATDRAGNTTVTNMSYTVVAGPVIIIASPVSGATWLFTATAQPQFTCFDVDAPLTDCTATIDGQIVGLFGMPFPVPDSNFGFGTHTFTVAATDAAGHTATESTTFSIWS